jgi:hypothetical protein
MQHGWQASRTIREWPNCGSLGPSWYSNFEANPLDKQKGNEARQEIKPNRLMAQPSRDSSRLSLMVSSRWVDTVFSCKLSYWTRLQWGRFAKANVAVEKNLSRNFWEACCCANHTLHFCSPLFCFTESKALKPNISLLRFRIIQSRLVVKVWNGHRRPCSLTPACCMCSSESKSRTR